MSEQKKQGKCVASDARPDPSGWCSQVYHRDSDYILADIYGRTRDECRVRAAMFRDLANTVDWK